MAVPKSFILLRIDLSLHQSLRERAQQERASVTQTIARAVKRYLEKPPKIGTISLSWGSPY